MGDAIRDGGKEDDNDNEHDRDADESTDGDGDGEEQTEGETGRMVNYRGEIDAEDWEEFKRNVPRTIRLPAMINMLIREFNEWDQDKINELISEFNDRK